MDAARLTRLAAIILCAAALACEAAPPLAPQPTHTATAASLPAAAGSPTSIPAVTPATPAPSPPPQLIPTASPTPVLRLRVIEDGGQTGLPPYDRGDWRHWIDADGDCQNTRHEVLIMESLVDVTFTGEDACAVREGEWLDPFTGMTFVRARDLDVDHMVPLANAHRSGGWEWDADTRRAYANSLDYSGHLIAVSASANRQKGARGPEGWRPPNESHWCQYAVDWITIKAAWRLGASRAELAALNEMLGTCEAEPALPSAAPP